jgi:hypothetical protein
MSAQCAGEGGAEEGGASAGSWTLSLRGEGEEEGVTDVLAEQDQSVCIKSCPAKTFPLSRMQEFIELYFLITLK